MGTVEDGQAIGDGELRSRVRLNVPSTYDEACHGAKEQDTRLNGEEESKDHGRVKKTFGRTPDGTGTDPLHRTRWKI